jgi:hypothetical protein
MLMRAGAGAGGGYAIHQASTELISRSWGRHFFGVALKLERGRIAIKDNG